MRASLAVLALVGVEGAPSAEIKKIVSLLEKMKDTVAEDQQKDSRVNEKMECWCDKNGEKQTLSEVQQAVQQKISFLEENIDAKNALVASHAVKLEQNKKDAEETKQSLTEETARYEKETEQYHADEVELQKSITALGNAVTVLSKHQAGLNQQKTILNLKSHLSKHTDMLDALLEPSSRSALQGFLQSSDKQAPGAYSSQSGEIFGILNQMKETFTADLAKVQEEIESSKNLFNTLRTERTNELKALEKTRVQLTEERAGAQQEMTDNAAELKELREKEGAQAEFYRLVKQKCPEHRDEYAKRVESRQNEMKAIDEAIEIMTSDTAFEGFSKVNQPASFLQVAKKSASNSSIKAHAAYLLRNQAFQKRTLHSKRFLALAHLAEKKEGRFDEVLKAIDNMKVALEEQMAAEVKQKDECTADITQKATEIADTENKLSTLNSERDRIDLEKQGAEEDAKNNGEELANLEKAKADRKEERQAEVAEFSQNVQDQEVALDLLSKAHRKLSMVFKSAIPEQGLLQQKQEPEGKDSEMSFTPPPSNESVEYKENAGGGVVLEMFVNLMNQSKASIAQLKSDNQKGQDTYMAEVDALSNEIKIMSATKTKAEGRAVNFAEDLLDKEDEIKAAGSELVDFQDAKMALHQQCDFLLKNFNIRQEAMQDEKEALDQAKAVLSGATFQ